MKIEWGLKKDEKKGDYRGLIVIGFKGKRKKGGKRGKKRREKKGERKKQFLSFLKNSWSNIWFFKRF